uniref:Helitron helicase n=1 Tax=Heterorhabditis bacteriophora TaxID=37862 RepID=A0A1I7WME0_HETBA
MRIMETRRMVDIGKKRTVSIRSREAGSVVGITRTASDSIPPVYYKLRYVGRGTHIVLKEFTRIPSEGASCRLADMVRERGVALQISNATVDESTELATDDVQQSAQLDENKLFNNSIKRNIVFHHGDVLSLIDRTVYDDGTCEKRICFWMTVNFGDYIDRPTDCTICCTITIFLECKYRDSFAQQGLFHYSPHLQCVSDFIRIYVEYWHSLMYLMVLQIYRHYSFSCLLLGLSLTSFAHFCTIYDLLYFKMNKHSLSGNYKRSTPTVISCTRYRRLYRLFLARPDNSYLGFQNT